MFQPSHNASSGSLTLEGLRFCRCHIFYF